LQILTKIKLTYISSRVKSLPTCCVCDVGNNIEWNTIFRSSYNRGLRWRISIIRYCHCYWFRRICIRAYHLICIFKYDSLRVCINISARTSSHCAMKYKNRSWGCGLSCSIGIENRLSTRYSCGPKIYRIRVNRSWVSYWEEKKQNQVSFHF